MSRTANRLIDLDQPPKLQVRCETCGKKARVPADYGDAIGVCPSCRHFIDIARCQIVPAWRGSPILEAELIDQPQRATRTVALQPVIRHAVQRQQGAAAEAAEFLARMAAGFVVGVIGFGLIFLLIPWIPFILAFVVASVIAQAISRSGNNGP